MGAAGTPLFPCIGRLGNRTGRNHVQQVLPLTLHSRAGLVGREAGVDVRHGHPCRETGTLGQSSHLDLNISRFSGNKRRRWIYLCCCRSASSRWPRCPGRPPLSPAAESGLQRACPARRPELLQSWRCAAEGRKRMRGSNHESSLQTGHHVTTDSASRSVTYNSINKGSLRLAS